MYLIGYHGTNQKIDLWDLSHLGKNQGQSIFPGIYFSETYDHAKEFAKLAVEKSGGKPIVYIAEVEIEKPLDLRKNKRVFNSFSEIREFCRKYFPDWFDQEGNLLSYKIDYVWSKLGTYSGNYSLIQYAAKENRLDLIEVLEDLGFDSAIDHGEFVITSPQQILSFQEVNHQLTKEELEVQQLPAEESIGERNTYAAFETKSNDYIRSSRNAKPYKTMPGNRFMRRVRIQANGGNNVWFDLDMNRLFKKGSFAVKIPVVGETDQYIVSISFEDWLPYLKQAIATTGFNQLTVKRSLAEMMRFHDLKIRCTCPDFHYRFSYWLTVNHEIEGEPELRPSDETNPRNDLGKGCKHVLFCLNTKSIFFDKVSRIIYNYFINLKRTQPLLFEKIIAPKLGLDQLDESQGGIKKPEPVVEPEEVKEEQPEQVNQPEEVETKQDNQQEIQQEEENPDVSQ